MQRKEHALCFSGHKNMLLPATIDGKNRLKSRVQEILDESILAGIETFYFGGCYEFDLFCAEMILHRKKIVSLHHPVAIRLIAVIPYEEQAMHWEEVYREKYYNIMALCNEVVILSTHYKQDCYQLRNRYMVDRCEKVVCYHDPLSFETAQIQIYANNKNKEVMNLYDYHSKK